MIPSVAFILYTKISMLDNFCVQKKDPTGFEPTNIQESSWSRALDQSAKVLG